MTFEDLGLGPQILKAIQERGYTQPTPIQEKAIPQILMTRDVMGLAQTGTGKTASFILPMLEILYGGRARARMPRSLILVPTRELAAQVAENFDIYGKYHKLTKALLIGGTSMDEQMKLLDRGVDVLIATPGRLLDLFDRGSILLSDIKILVIDEADRMLDMGFIPDIEKIVSKVPPIRQTLMFSATMPPEIKKLGDKFLSNPKQVSVAALSKPAETVEQGLVWVNKRNKRKVLGTLLAKEQIKNAFVFCNRKRDIAGLAKFLKGEGYAAAPMHGDMVQSARMETLQKFKDGEVTLLVCSDVAARGLDVSAVSHVFNYDVPMSAEDYVHRIGRTGRAGMAGRSWTLATTEDDKKFVDAIERLIKKPIPVADPDTLEPGGGTGAVSAASETESVKERPEEEGRGKSRGRRGRRGRGGKPETSGRPEKTEKQESPREERPAEDKRPPREDRQRDRNRGGRDRAANDFPEDKDVIGFGNEMPDFMKRK